MKSKNLFVVLSLLLVVALIAGCQRLLLPQPQRLPRRSRRWAKPYIPVISKGFQHQFWQAVKLGAQNAAKDLNVDITSKAPR